MYPLKKLLCRYFPILCLGFLAGAAAVACNGEPPLPRAKTAEVAPDEKLLSLAAAAEVDGWAPAGEASTFAGERLFEHIDGGADIYYEYGFDALLVQQYNKEDKAVFLEIYRMNDPAAAFGIYSYNRHPSLSPAEAGTDATIHPNGLFFWQDAYYVDIRQSGAAQVSPDDFLLLARAISGAIGEKPEGRPAVMGLLPKENRVEQSEVYARGRLAINNQVYVADEDLFGLKEGESAAIARYGIDQPEFSLILAQYSGEEASGAALSRFRAHYLDSDAGENEFILAAMPGKHMAVKKVGRYLAVVANADTGERATDMLSAVSERLQKEME